MSNSSFILYIALCMLFINCLALPRSADVATKPGYSTFQDINKAYSLKYTSLDWDGAKKACAEDGAKLATPKTQAEFSALQSIVRSMSYKKVSPPGHKEKVVWLGITSKDDYTSWKNIDGENINDTAFHTWASNNGEISNNPDEPHCVVMDSINQGLRDYWCHRQLPYLCQIDL